MKKWQRKSLYSLNLPKKRKGNKDLQLLKFYGKMKNLKAISLQLKKWVIKTLNRKYKNTVNKS